jgi:hypothetical protein
MSGELLGRRLLRLDAGYCAGAGLISIGLFAPLARLLDAPTGAPLAAGAATLAWAIVLMRLARRADWRPSVAGVAAANALAATAIGAVALFTPATGGRLLLAAVAVEVAGFAVGQAASLRRA